ncbi:MAG: hypothetical protein ACO34E_16420 [Limisphaerales bacterium]|jgi:hypothetical protein
MKREILQMLEQCPGQPMSVKEISRRVDREQYRKDASWARPFLRALVEEQLILQDNNHCFYAPEK